MSGRQLTTTKLRKNLSFYLIKNRAEVSPVNDAKCSCHRSIYALKSLNYVVLLLKSIMEFKGTTQI